jgi:hypothetical protein
MPQGTLRKRNPEHQNWDSKLIPRTGENHHTDPKKKLSKGSLTYTPRNRGEQTYNGQAKTKPPELRHKTIGSANLKHFSKKKTTKISASQQDDGTHTMVKEKLKNQGKPLKLREGSSEARQQRWWGTTTRPCVRACASERASGEQGRCGCCGVLT